MATVAERRTRWVLGFSLKHSVSAKPGPVLSDPAAADPLDTSAPVLPDAPVELVSVDSDRGLVRFRMPPPDPGVNAPLSLRFYCVPEGVVPPADAQGYLDSAWEFSAVQTAGLTGEYDASLPDVPEGSYFTQSLVEYPA